MDPSNLTTRSQDALSTAVRRAAADGNPQVDTLHLLAALLAQPESTAAALLRAVGSDPRQVAEAAEDEIGKLPAATGSSVTAPSLARPVYEVLQRAADLAEELGDEYVSTEHLTVGLATVD
ncbi:MAG: Clp protease N-terminal domain-containing protein, partial [Nocardioidaceae bacterium]